MAEVTRPATASSRGGRGSGRGGRAGFGGRGRSKAADDQNEATAPDADGALGALRKKHGIKLTILKEMFADWSDGDLLSALEDADGDEGRVAELISAGAIEPWREVQKDTPRPKVKEQQPDAPSARPARGGRVASEGIRGRGRNIERGGARAPRGRSQHPQHPATDGPRQDNRQLSVPTNESNSWGISDKAIAASSAWETQDTPSKPAPTPAAAVPSTKPSAEPVKQTWATMLRKSTEPPKPAPKPREVPAPKPAEPIEPLPPAPVELAALEPHVEAPALQPEPAQPEPEPTAAAQPEPELTAAAQPEPESRPEELAAAAIVEPEIALPPPKDQLTQSNLEQVLDASRPVVTETAASTAADSWDPRAASASIAITPLQPSQAAAATASGYATSALKATAERSVRTPSFVRRVLDQEEAVRMPGNREVDGTAVQFGAFNLGEDADEEVDEPGQEPAETRAQPPADSPMAHPRTALPPAQPAVVPDAFGAQKPVGVLPTSAVPAGAPTGPSVGAGLIAPSGPVAHQHLIAASQLQNQQQFNRFEPPTAAHDSYQKPFGAFGQQAPGAMSAAPQHQPLVDAYQQHSQAQTQPGLAATTGPSDYSSYATADQQNRNYLYGGYYNNTANYPPQGQQDTIGSQNRGAFGAGFNTSHDTLSSQYPQSNIHSQARYHLANETHSGHSTPTPAAQSQAPGQQGQQGQQPPQQGAQGSQHQPHGQGGYPGYNHPYMQSQYYAAYGFPYGAYGAPYGKGYGHPYGGAGAHFEPASSPAPGFGQAAGHRNETGPASGLDTAYGRAGTQGAGSQPTIGGGMGGFGSAHDTFRSASYQSQGQGFGSSQPAGGAPGNDDLKPFGDTKAAAHSPALAGVRPTSAANNAGQSGLPPPANAGQGQMGGFGGYPGGHLGHLQQTYGMGGSAANSQQQQGSSYGGNGGYQGAGAGFGAASGYGGGYGNQGHGHRAGSGWGSNYN